MSPFDFLNSINQTKVDLLKQEPPASKDYAPFIVNRGLSYFPDTILSANEMNQRFGIPVEWQYGFLLNVIGKRRRFSKWIKKEPASKTVDLLKEVYGYSDQKAIRATALLTDDQVKSLEQLLQKGGRKK